jgi:uncharacterized RDD family membrane protein YckC
LYDGPQPTSNKIGRPRGSGSRYSVGFIIIAGIIGLLCLVAAIALTISGTLGLRDYGFANGPLIAGIVLLGVGGVLGIVACLAAGLK